MWFAVTLSENQNEFQPRVAGVRGWAVSAFLKRAGPVVADMCYLFVVALHPRSAQKVLNIFGG